MSIQDTNNRQDGIFKQFRSCHNQDENRTDYISLKVQSSEIRDFRSSKQLSKVWNFQVRQSIKDCAHQIFQRQKSSQNYSFFYATFGQCRAFKNKLEIWTLLINLKEDSVQQDRGEPPLAYIQVLTSEFCTGQQSGHS